MTGRAELIRRGLVGVHLAPATVVHDVAARDGGLSRLATALTGGRTVVHDLDRGELRRAREAHLPAVRGDVRRLPFKDATSGLTLAFEIIEHFEPWEATAFLDELYRVTAPGGYLALTTPNRYSLQSLRGLARYLRDGTVWNANDTTHIRLFSARALERAVARRFTVRRRLGYYLVPEMRGRPTRWTFTVTQRPPLAAISHKLFILAQKPR